MAEVKDLIVTGSAKVVGDATVSGTVTSPTFNGNATTATKAASATISNTLLGSYTGNGGQQNPNYFGTNKVGCLMMNTTVNGDTHYKDWLIMDAYSGSDVGGGTAIGVDRQEMKAFIMGSDAARTAWTRSAELLTTSNYSSYALPLSGGTMTGNISYKGTKNTYEMIKFIDNTADTYGNGIRIGGGGATIIGGGESPDTITVSSGGDEVMAIANDNGIDFYSNCQDGLSYAKHMTFDTNGTLTVPTSVTAPTFTGNATSASTAAQVTVQGDVSLSSTWTRGIYRVGKPEDTPAAWGTCIIGGTQDHKTDSDCWNYQLFHSTNGSWYTRQAVNQGDWDASWNRFLYEGDLVVFDGDGAYYPDQGVFAIKANANGGTITISNASTTKNFTGVVLLCHVYNSASSRAIYTFGGASTWAVSGTDCIIYVTGRIIKLA